MGWGKRDRNDGWYDADVGAGENVPGLGETLVIASQLERVFGAAPDEDLKGAARLPSYYIRRRGRLAPGRGFE